eukprot:1160524-Pelagomonas_calceolata.AAC.12
MLEMTTRNGLLRTGRKGTPHCLVLTSAEVMTIAVTKLNLAPCIGTIDDSTYMDRYCVHDTAYMDG